MDYSREVAKINSYHDVSLSLKRETSDEVLSWIDTGRAVDILISGIAAYDAATVYCVDEEYSHVELFSRLRKIPNFAIQERLIALGVRSEVAYRFNTVSQYYEEKFMYALRSMEISDGIRFSHSVM